MNILLIGLLALASVMSLHAAEKPRLAVLTDIGGDPDDQQTMVRLMVYANEFRIEALIATSAGIRGQLKEPVIRPDLIKDTIRAYGEVRPNLARHAGGWPEEEALLACVKAGNKHRERAFIGENHDTEASEFLLQRIDGGKAEDPLNISVWGGQTDLAQVLWKVKKERGKDGFRTFAKKFRVFDIDDQDGIASWMRGEFPGMFYILSKPAEGADRRTGTYRGMYLTGDETLTSAKWIGEHVLSSGPLGKLYPTKTWTAPNPYGCMKEGDTPSWFFFLPLGGNDPADPSRSGWGGQYQREADGWYRDVPAKKGEDPRRAVSRWRPDFQTDFALRMSWCRNP